MNQEPPVPPPVDPWADATISEETTPPVIYARPRWELDQQTVPAAHPAPGTDPDPTGTPTSVRPGGGRRGLIAVLAVAVTVLLLAAGIVLGKTLGGGHAANGPTQGSAATSGQPATGPATATPPSPGHSQTASQDASPTASAGSASPTPAASRPTSPDEAAALSDAQAVTELGTEANESAATLVALAGYWVPQVDGKCVGIPVDIQPSWIPDGTQDIQHVSIQQILAFHLTLNKRFGALTVRPSQLGFAADAATSGPCSGHVVWNSIVPQKFDTPEAANDWCDTNVPPVHECLARYVPKPGQMPAAKERT